LIFNRECGNLEKKYKWKYIQIDYEKRSRNGEEFQKAVNLGFVGCVAHGCRLWKR
jgi:hypothetical protein